MDREISFDYSTLHTFEKMADALSELAHASAVQANAMEVIAAALAKQAGLEFEDD